MCGIIGKVPPARPPSRPPAPRLQTVGPDRAGRGVSLHHSEPPPSRRSWVSHQASWCSEERSQEIILGRSLFEGFRTK